MKFLSLVSLLVFLIFLPFHSTFAAKKTAATKNYNGPVFDPKLMHAPFNETKIAQRIKTSEANRFPSNADLIDENKLSNDVKLLISRIHGCSSSEDYEELLNDLEKNYEQSPREIQFYTANLMLLKPFRGIVYRMIPLLKKKTRFIHSQLLTWVKGMASNATVMFPYQHAGAAFEYLSSPYYDENGKIVTSFNSEKEVQAYLASSVIPSMMKGIARIESLNLEEPIIWDQRIVFGKSSFADNLNRFKYIGEFEKNVALADLYAGASSIAFFISYNVDDAFTLYKELGFLYGFDGFGPFNSLDGVSGKKIHDLLVKPEFEHLGTLLPNGKKWMNFSLDMTKLSVKRLTDAYNNASVKRNKSELFMASKWYSDLDRSKIEENLKLANQVIFSDGAEALRSSVSGEVIKINFAEIYKNPPQDLKDFSPIGFEKGSKVRRKITKGPGTGQTVEYRKYVEGMGTEYNLAKYKTYFPSVNSNDDIYRIQRVLSHQRGNWLRIVK